MRRPSRVSLLFLAAYCAAFSVSALAGDVQILSDRAVTTTVGIPFPVAQSTAAPSPQLFGGVWPKPLASREDARKIAAAHAAAFLDCGVDQSPPRAIGGDEKSLTKFVETTDFIALRDAHKILLLPQFGRGGIVNLDNYAIETPQCPAGIVNTYWSERAARILFVIRKVKAISYQRPDSTLWDAKFGSAFELVAVDGTSGMRKLLSLTEDKVLDAQVSEFSDAVQLLTMDETMSIANPRNWLYALAGHPPVTSTIFVRQIGWDGRAPAKATLARNVPFGSARFVDGH